MKTGACPKCNGTELYEIEKMLVENHRYSNSVETFSLTAGYGMYGKNMANERVAVGARAYVCAKCSYTEIYADDMETLERLAVAGTHQVRKVKR
jgi:predicted nucleic-acid-binding Zn-ribbon protein